MRQIFSDPAKVKQPANNNRREFRILKVVDNMELEGRLRADVSRDLTVQKTESLAATKEGI